MSDPPALTTVDAVAQLSFRVHGLLDRRAAAAELSLAQIRLLGILRDREPTMRELAGLLELDKSSVSGLVDRAERRGLVARRPSRSDRRAVHVALTPAGRTLVTRVADAFARDVDGLLGVLSTGERAALTAALSRALLADADARGVDAESADAAGGVRPPTDPHTA